MVEWRPVIIGTIFVIATYLILSLAENGGVNAVISFLLGGLIVGFIIASKISYIEKIKYSLIHGAILGVIAGVISIIILIIQLVVVGLSSLLDTSIIPSVLILLAYNIIAALAGVIIGNFARAEYITSVES
jgi:hypothetical protein